MRGLRVLAGLEEPAAPRATPCTASSPCRNPQHDHLDEDDQPSRCADCGQPMHFDNGLIDFLHDDPEAPACFLITERTPR